MNENPVDPDDQELEDDEVTDPLYGDEETDVPTVDEDD